MKKTISLLLTLLLVVGILPAGVFGMTAMAVEADSADTAAQAELADTGELDYTDPETPYIATTYAGLYNVFNMHRPDGKKIYIKLGADIKHTVTDGEEFVLRTDGADVELDINGHDLYVVDTRDKPSSVELINGRGNNTVTIVDSVAAYSDTIYNGKQKGIRYYYVFTDSNSDFYSMVLAGNIIVKSGYFYNENNDVFTNGHSCVYSGSNLKMYGGLFDAATPIELYTSPDHQSVIDGGTLRIRVDGYYGIRMIYHLERNDKIPMILNCDILSHPGRYHSEAFDIHFNKNLNSKSATLEEFKKLFPYLSSVYLNGSKESSVTNGIGYASYEASGTSELTGPSIDLGKRYTIRSKNLIDELYVLSYVPYAGNTVDSFYFGHVYSGDGYQVETSKNTGNWRNGVMWKHSVNGKALSAGDVFEIGKTYTVYVSLVPTNTNEYAFAPREYTKAVMNGNEANIYYYSDTNYGVYYTYTIADPVIHDIYVNVPEPKAGELMTYESEVDLDAPYQVADVNTSAVWKNGVSWKMDGVIKSPNNPVYFCPDSVFSVDILVDLKDTANTEFSTGSEFKVYVNGKQGTYNMVSDTRCSVSYSFAVSKNLIDSVAVTVPEPVMRGAVGYSASVNSFADYKIQNYSHYPWKNGVSWNDGEDDLSPSDAGIFEPGKTYTVAVLLDAKDTDNYTFAAPKSVSATINGEKASVSKMSGGGISVSCSYSMPANKGTTGDCEWEVTGDGKLIISGSGAMDVFSWNDPHPWDPFKNEITVVQIESGVTNAGNNAFKDLPNLTAALIGDDVKSISGSAFYGCPKLSSVDIGSGVTFIGMAAFMDCPSLKIVTIPANVTAFSDKPFGYILGAQSYEKVGGFTIYGYEGSAAQSYANSNGFNFVALTEQPGVGDPAQEITSIAVAVPEPVEGEHPSYYATVPKGLGYAVEDYNVGNWKNGVRWHEGEEEILNTAVFKIGNDYEVHISVILTDSEKYKFIDVNNMTATVNGQEARVTYFSDDNYVVEYTFSLTAPPEKEVITNISVTIPEPKAGENPSYSAVVPEGLGYAIEDYNVGNWNSGILWQDSSHVIEETAVFESNEDYTVTISVALTDDMKYEFAAYDEMTVTVNGKQADLQWRSSDKCIVSYSFSLRDPAYMIDSVSAAIPEPVAGELMSYSASVPDDAPYSVEDFNNSAWRNGVIWYDKDGMEIEPGAVFKAGEEYTVWVSLILPDDDDSWFPNDGVITATLNGNAAEVYRYSSKNVGVYCTFTVSEVSAVEYLLGDVDESGKVNVFDASYILKGTTGTKGYPDYKNMDSSSLDFKRADVDGSGTVNIFDAALVLKHATGDKTVEKYGIGKTKTA